MNQFAFDLEVNMGKHGEGLHEKEKEGIARDDHDYGSESRFGYLVHLSTRASTKHVGENVTNLNLFTPSRRC